MALLLGDIQRHKSADIHAHECEGEGEKMSISFLFRSQGAEAILCGPSGHEDSYDA